MIPDVTQYAIVSASSIFAVYVLVTFAKVPIDRSLPTTDPLHDWAIRLCACLFGVIMVLLATAVLHPLTGQSVFIAVTQGVMAGLSAIGTYHLVSGGNGPMTPLLTAGKVDDPATLPAAKTTPPPTVSQPPATPPSQPPPA